MYKTKLRNMRKKKITSRINNYWKFTWTYDRDYSWFINRIETFEHSWQTLLTKYWNNDVKEFFLSMKSKEIWCVKLIYVSDWSSGKIIGWNSLICIVRNTLINFLTWIRLTRFLWNRISSPEILDFPRQKTWWIIFVLFLYWIKIRTSKSIPSKLKKKKKPINAFLLNRHVEI